MSDPESDAAFLVHGNFLLCALQSNCDTSDMSGLVDQLGSAGEHLVEWTAESLADVFFTYPHQPTPVSPAAPALSIALSNTPFWGDLYDLSIAVTGYDFVTGQYVAGWERLVNLVGILPILGVAGANMRYGLRNVDALMSHGDDLARYIGKAGRACSFDEETPVTTDEGAIPIKDVDVGDKVLAWDEATDSTGYFLVTATWAHEEPVIVLLTIGGAHTRLPTETTSGRTHKKSRPSRSALETIVFSKMNHA